MAPPGRNYAFDGVPQSFMRKQPVPEGEDTNTRAIVIFFSYLTLCFSLTVFVIRRLFKSYGVLSKSRTARLPPAKYVFIFAFLAVSSLATTWFYMFQYFKVSYQTWLMWRSYYELDPEHLHWGLWLKHTSLFKEAWETAIIGYARYWWSNQIFFFACGLGLYLEREGIPRGIRHTWAFMLLGQVVSVSFATNLFLLALLLSPLPPPAALRGGITRNRWLGPWIVNLLAVGATVYSAYQLRHEYYWHHASFMSLLLVPHVALLILPVIRGLVPARYFVEDDVEYSGSAYKNLLRFTIGGGVILWVWMTALSYGFSRFRGIKDALLEHPAVSIVGFDVIFSWISWIIWWWIQLDDQERVPGRDGDGFEKDDGWTDAGLGTAMAGNDVGGEMRRR